MEVRTRRKGGPGRCPPATASAQLLPAAAARPRPRERPRPSVAARGGPKVEVKLRLGGQADYERLASLLAPGAGPVYQQENVFFDGPASELNARRVVVRVRLYNKDQKATLTVKVPRRAGGAVWLRGRGLRGRWPPVCTHIAACVFKAGCSSSRLPWRCTRTGPRALCPLPRHTPPAASPSAPSSNHPRVSRS
jgi:hypothetical protein